MILDTQFLIDLLRGESHAVMMAQEIERAGTPVRATAPSVFQIQAATHSLPAHKRALVHELLDALTTLPLDAECARRAAAVAAEARAASRMLSWDDAMIAGFALHHNEQVLTRNEALLTVRGLKTQRY